MSLEAFSVLAVLDIEHGFRFLPSARHLGFQICNVRIKWMFLPVFGTLSECTSKDKQPEQQAASRGTPPPPPPTTQQQQQQQQQGGQKRRRADDDDEEEDDGRRGGELQSKLVEILDRSSRMVAAQLEAQNANSRLDREQRRDQAASLAVVLGRLADALGRIADKL
uniref:Uncharacterized protein n=1 Tax=Oryza barthii TaxID=65489 RepID=A0A0D3F5N2_9ORYZ